MRYLLSSSFLMTFLFSMNGLKDFGAMNLPSFFTSAGWSYCGEYSESWRRGCERVSFSTFLIPCFSDWRKNWVRSLEISFLQEGNQWRGYGLWKY
jgi:hypothetical protein